MGKDAKYQTDSGQEHILDPIKAGHCRHLSKSRILFLLGLAKCPQASGGAAQDITDSTHLQGHLPAPWPSSEVRAETGALGVTRPCPPATLADQAPTSARGACGGDAQRHQQKKNVTKAADTKCYQRRLQAVSLPALASPGCPRSRYSLDRILKERGDGQSALNKAAQARHEVQTRQKVGPAGPTVAATHTAT